MSSDKKRYDGSENDITLVKKCSDIGMFFFIICFVFSKPYKHNVLM